MDKDARFWAAVAKIETDYIADCDQAQFKRRMRRKGFDEDTITERMAAVDDESRFFSGRPAPSRSPAEPEEG